MPRVTVIQFDGSAIGLEAEAGSTLMDTVVQNGVSGIDGDCGGGCACGTCHCFVDAPWLEMLPAIAPMEEGMLRNRPDRQPNSRLACQISITRELSGMVVRLPQYQM